MAPVLPQKGIQTAKSIFWGEYKVGIKLVPRKKFTLLIFK